MEDSLSYCKNCGTLLPPYPGRGPRRRYCTSTSCNSQGRSKKITIHIKKYQWSKYGGANKVLQHTQVDEIWCCQACGQEQPKELPAYRFPFGVEYLRICANCHAAVVKNAIDDFFDIVKNL